MSTFGANTVGAVEMAAPVAVGGVLAATLYNLLLPTYLTLPVVNRAIFGADAHPPLAAAAGEC